jgi:hypothetical protein
MTSRTLVIDCPPGTSRPDFHLKMSGAKEKWFESKVNRFFGEWTWTLKPNHYQDYDNIKNDIGDYLTKAYHSGSVRYAEW